MSQVAIQAASMSSVEISDLTGKDHRNVMRDIRNVLISLENTSAQNRADVPARLETSLDDRNRPREIYVLDKHLTMVLITGYSIPLRSAVIRRWEELEAMAATNDLTVGRMSLSELETFMEERFIQFLSERNFDQESHPPTAMITRPVENQEDLFNPTQLGFTNRVSGQRMNRILLDLNFQTRDEFGYTPTRQAEGLYEEVLRRRNRAGRIVVKFLWKRRVLQLIPARYLA